MNKRGGLVILPILKQTKGENMKDLCELVLYLLAAMAFALSGLMAGGIKF